MSKGHKTSFFHWTFIDLFTINSNKATVIVHYWTLKLVTMFKQLMTGVLDQSLGNLIRRLTGNRLRNLYFKQNPKDFTAPLPHKKTIVKESNVPSSIHIYSQCEITLSLQLLQFDPSKTALKTDYDIWIMIYFHTCIYTCNNRLLPLQNMYSWLISKYDLFSFYDCKQLKK